MVVEPALVADGEVLQSISRPPGSLREIGDQGPESGVAVVVCTYNRPTSLRRFLDSLGAQDRQPDQLIVVDASTRSDTEEDFKSYPDIDRLAKRVLYFKVSESVRGLTRQRNFSLRWVATDLVAFFDDDVELMPDCLLEMERAHRLSNDQAIGVTARVLNQSGGPTLRWRILLLLRVISQLRPGRYDRSGVLMPWGLLAPTDSIVEGDYVPGYAMMWKTSVVREYRFDESFHGYGYGEDLDLSLRARGVGRLLLAGKARILHWLDPAGRPDAFRFGYMEVLNRYRIHRRAFWDLGTLDHLRFSYAWLLDTLLLVRQVFSRQWSGRTFKQIAGRLRGAFDIIRGVDDAEN